MYSLFQRTSNHEDSTEDSIFDASTARYRSGRSGVDLPEYLLIFRSGTGERIVYLLERLLESKLRVVDESRVSCKSCW